MSKLTKLIKHPILFFSDRKKKILARDKPTVKKPTAKKPVVKKPVVKKPVVKKPAVKKPAVKKPAVKKPAATTKSKIVKKEPEMIQTVKHIFSTMINDIPVSNTTLEHYEVALYFAGGMGNIYQVEQWVGPLNELHKKKKVVVIARIRDVYEWLVVNTDFVVVYCKTIADLTKVYEENNFKCVLYVNHAFKNFQSLITGNAMHVHINHGESDKTSTITNQSKGYDYIFIVGDAGYDKYNLNLIKKNMDNFIQVGRPQLDHIEKIRPFDDSKLITTVTVEKPLENKVNSFNMHTNDVQKIHETDIETVTKTKKVVLYAPTWEGTHDSMNFTSLDDFGMSLVQQLVNHPEYYLVYKPHPNTGSRVESTKGINNAIIKLLKTHEGGEVILGGDINSLYEHIDLAIFDNSAVAIDYLQVDKPMIMTDMFHRVRDRKSKPTITKAARMLSAVDAYSIPMLVSDEIENDTLKIMRNKIRQYFLGDFDYSKKESTKTFISQIFDIIDERDMLVEVLEKINEEADEIS